eukprot:1794067-Pyramimonas_sp.AAC.1
MCIRDRSERERESDLQGETERASRCSQMAPLHMMFTRREREREREKDREIKRVSERELESERERERKRERGTRS